MSLLTIIKARKEAKPVFMATQDIPKAIEVDATLFQAATGNKRNQYRGRIDDAGTVRVRVYAPGKYQDLGGEIVTATVEEADLIVAEGDDQELAKLEWNLDNNVLVVAWAPIEADLASVKVTLG